jgi:hypothetical protein
MRHSNRKLAVELAFARIGSRRGIWEGESTVGEPGESFFQEQVFLKSARCVGRANSSFHREKQLFPLSVTDAGESLRLSAEISLARREAFGGPPETTNTLYSIFTSTLYWRI